MEIKREKEGIKESREEEMEIKREKEGIKESKEKAMYDERNLTNQEKVSVKLLYLKWRRKKIRYLNENKKIMLNKKLKATP